MVFYDLRQDGTWIFADNLWHRRVSPQLDGSRPSKACRGMRPAVKGGGLLRRWCWFRCRGARGLGPGIAHAVADPVLVRLGLRQAAIDRRGNVTAGEWRLAVGNGV